MPQKFCESCHICSPSTRPSSSAASSRSILGKRFCAFSGALGNVNVMICSAVPGRTGFFRSFALTIGICRYYGHSRHSGSAPEWALGQFPFPEEKAPLGLLVPHPWNDLLIYNPLCKRVWTRGRLPLSIVMASCAVWGRRYAVARSASGRRLTAH